ncbi:MAG TPA: tetratricopeptide repeat protein, partial [Verrucomicrobiae bacterium]|nr:tetratricopeptide repeat protein [Verrucomicrobiae bacterium]
NAWQDMGDHRRAITNYQQAVSSYRLAFSGANTNLALALGHLGSCQSFTEDVTNGNHNARLGLQMARECGDKEVLIRCLRLFGQSFKAWGMGSLEGAPYFREAYELRKQQGSDPIKIANSMSDLSSTLTNNAEALKMTQEVLALYRQHLPPDHPTIVGKAFTLGQLLMGEGQFAEAEEALREAHRGFQKIHAANQPYQGFVLRFFAASMLAQGKGDEAEAVVRKQLESTPTHAGHLDVLNRVLTFRRDWPLDDEILQHMRGDFLWDMTDSYVRFDDQADAEQLFRDMLRRQSERHGPESPNAQKAMRRLADYNARQRAFAEADQMGLRNADLAGPIRVRADLSASQGKFAEAESLYREELVLRRRFPGNRDREIGWALHKLGSVLRDQGRFTEAETNYHESLSAFGPEDAGVPVTLNTLANMLGKRNRSQEAENLHREAAEVARKLPAGPEHDEFLEWSLGDLAQVLQQQGKLDEAEARFRDALEISMSFSPDTRHKTEVNVAGLLDIFRLKGRYDDAEKLFSEVLTPDVLKLPQSAGLLRLRSDFSARRGRWNEAAAETAKLVEAEPSNHFPYHLLAPLLVASGDVDGYRRLCDRIQVQFAGIQDPFVGERMAKACLILPNEKLDFQIINRWIKTALTVDRNSILFQYSRCVAGLAAFRQSNHSQALESARMVLGVPGTDPHPEIAAWTVIAMANHRLKQTNAAVTALSQARELANAKLPKLEAGDLGPGWNDWIITQALLREAGSLIEGMPPETDVFSVKY